MAGIGSIGGISIGGSTIVAVVSLPAKIILNAMPLYTVMLSNLLLNTLQLNASPLYSVTLSEFPL